MKMYVRFIIIWAVNYFILFFANLYYPGNYVLGNAVMTPVMSGLLSSFLLTLFLKFFKAFAKPLSGNRYRMFGYYFLGNSIGIWIIARLSVISGFGIPAFYWAFYLGFVSTLIQWLARQLFKKSKLI